MLPQDTPKKPPSDAQHAEISTSTHEELPHEDEGGQRGTDALPDLAWTKEDKCLGNAQASPVARPELQREPSIPTSTRGSSAEHSDRALAPSGIRSVKSAGTELESYHGLSEPSASSNEEARGGLDMKTRANHATPTKIPRLSARVASWKGPAASQDGTGSPTGSYFDSRSPLGAERAEGNEERDDNDAGVATGVAEHEDEVEEQSSNADTDAMNSRASQSDGTVNGRDSAENSPPSSPPPFQIDVTSARGDDFDTLKSPEDQEAPSPSPLSRQFERASFEYDVAPPRSPLFTSDGASPHRHSKSRIPRTPTRSSMSYEEKAVVRDSPEPPLLRRALTAGGTSPQLQRRRSAAFQFSSPQDQPTSNTAHYASPTHAFRRRKTDKSEWPQSPTSPAWKFGNPVLERERSSRRSSGLFMSRLRSSTSSYADSNFDGESSLAESQYGDSRSSYFGDEEEHQGFVVVPAQHDGDDAHGGHSSQPAPEDMDSYQRTIAELQARLAEFEKTQEALKKKFLSKIESYHEENERLRLRVQETEGANELLDRHVEETSSANNAQAQRIEELEKAVQELKEGHVVDFHHIADADWGDIFKKQTERLDQTIAARDAHIAHLTRSVDTLLTLEPENEQLRSQLTRALDDLAAVQDRLAHASTWEEEAKQQRQMLDQRAAAEDSETQRLRAELDEAIKAYQQLLPHSDDPDAVTVATLSQRLEAHAAAQRETAARLNELKYEKAAAHRELEKHMEVVAALREEIHALRQGQLPPMPQLDGASDRDCVFPWDEAAAVARRKAAMAVFRAGLKAKRDEEDRRDDEARAERRAERKRRMRLVGKA